MSGPAQIVIYADPNDFYLTSTNSVYETARSGAGTLSVVTGASIVLGNDFDGASTYTLYEAFFSFDTSAIAPAAVVGAGISLSGIVVGGGGAGALEFFARSWSGSTGDWVPGASLPALGAVFVLNYGPGTYVGVGYAQSSTFQLVAVDSRIENDVVPGGVNNITFNSADTAGTSSDPALLLYVTPAVTKTITATGAGSITINGGGANDPPAGVTSLTVEAWGGGSSPTAATSQEGGGSGSDYSRKYYTGLVNGDVIFYSVAIGGLTGGNPGGDTWTHKTTNSSVGAECVAKGALTGTGGSPGTSVGDVKFTGAAGAAAQAGGGSRGGSSGGTSAGSAANGTGGNPGSSSTGGAAVTAPTDGGNSGKGGNVSVSGDPGVQPGGGAGGGGSSGGNGGNGGDGQIKFSWMKPVAALHSLQINNSVRRASFF